MSQVFWNSTANCFVPFAVLRRMPSAMPIAAATPIAGAPRITIVRIALRDFLRGAAAHVEFLAGQLALIDHDDRVVLPIDCREHGVYFSSRLSNGSGSSSDEPEPRRRPVQVGEDDIDVAAVLPEQLAARAARRRRRLGVGDDGDAGEARCARRTAP